MTCFLCSNTTELGWLHVENSMQWPWARFNRNPVMIPWFCSLKFRWLNRLDRSILKVINPGCSWKDWCWSWSSNSLTTWCEETTLWERPWCWESESEVAQSCPTLCEPMDCTCQAPLSMGCSRQEYWCGLPFPSPGDLPDPGIKPASPALAVGFFTTEPPETP